MRDRHIILSSLLAIGIALVSFACGWRPEPNPAPTPSGGGLVKSDHNPLITEGEPDGWMALKADPVVIKDGDTYKMWFTGAGSDMLRIGYATSPDGIVWDVHPEPVFEPGEPGTWDDFNVETVFVLKDEGVYKMWYSGFQDWEKILAQEASMPAIGYATSEDGIHWTRYGDGPVIDQYGVQWYGKRDDGVAWADPHVIKEDGVHKMWLHGCGTVNPEIHAIAYATSLDGIQWELHPDNPVFDVDPASRWENLAVFAPAVVVRGDTYEMWYGASPTKDGDFDTQGLTAYIARATSEDGINWTRDPANPILGPAGGGSGTWDEDGVLMPTAILDGDTLKMWYVGVGRQGSWYAEETRGFQYQIGYAESK